MSSISTCHFQINFLTFFINYIYYIKKYVFYKLYSFCFGVNLIVPVQLDTIHLDRKMTWTRTLGNVQVSTFCPSPPGYLDTLSKCPPMSVIVTCYVQVGTLCPSVLFCPSALFCPSVLCHTDWCAG